MLQPKVMTTLNILAAVSFAILVGLVLFVVPTERTMGDVQRLFYIHVAPAWICFVAFAVTAICGIVYLRTGQMRWDRISAASVEVGLVFTIIATITGSVWARPAWNTWWTWDPRLTTFTIMALIYVAYLMLRQGLDDPARRARFGAVYSLVGFISVPITFFSIRIWRTIHPAVIGTGSATSQGGFDMTPAMTATVIFAQVAFLLLYFCLLANRLKLGELAEKVEQRKAELASAS